MAFKPFPKKGAVVPKAKAGAVSPKKKAVPKAKAKAGAKAMPMKGKMAKGC